jgi:hypothetical protein
VILLALLESIRSLRRIVHRYRMDGVYAAGTFLGCPERLKSIIQDR